MTWIITQVNLIGDGGGKTKCTFKAYVSEEGDLTEIHNAISDGNDKIDVLEEFVGSYLYKFKDCFIQSFKYTTEPDKYAELDLIALDVEIQDSMKVKFKDGKKKVINVSDYVKVKKQYCKPEELSYSEYESRCMALKI